jgi:hypothetical protein
MPGAIVFVAFISGVIAGPALGNLGIRGVKYAGGMSQFRPSPRMYQGATNQFVANQFAVPQLSAPQQRSVAVGSELADRQEWISSWKSKQGAGDVDTGAMAGKNVFGGDLDQCSASEACTYTAESPQICVGLAPRVRQGQSTSFELKAPEGQFQWKPEYIGQCIPFAEFGSDSFMKGLRFGNQDLVPKCTAIPSSIFTSAFSLDLWQNCLMEAKEYKYVSPASSKFKSDSTETTKKDPFYIKKTGEEQPDLMSPKCARFRQGIERLAMLCSDQGDASQMANLNGMKASMNTKLFGTSPSNVTGVAAAGLVFFLVGSAVSFAMFSSRRRAINRDDKLLG